VINPSVFYDYLNENGVNFFSGVPDSLLKNICSYITDNTLPECHIIAANEGNALSIGLGYHLSTGRIPFIYMQNSGLGNVINPLLSLADPDVYSVPMLLMIGWRGEPGVHDEPQHKKQGRVTIALLKAMEIPFKIISPSMQDSDVVKLTNVLLEKSKSNQQPVALLVQKDAFVDYELMHSHFYDRPMLREQAIETIVDNLKPLDIVVSTTGVASRELFEIRERSDSRHESDFLTVGGMGHASQIALGIALQSKDRMVYCLDGDGAIFMHMGGLTINGTSGCNNFKHIVFNNSAHDSVGGQPTVGDQVDICTIAIASGYRWAKRASTEEELRSSVKLLSDVEGPALLEVQVKRGFRKDLGRPGISPAENKQNFMGFIG